MSVSLAFISAPLGLVFPQGYDVTFYDWDVGGSTPWLLPVMSVLGVAMLFATLHLARAIGRLHGWLAKHLLVRDPVV